MRFHIGFSKRIPFKTLIKLGIGLALLLLYYGSTMVVHASSYETLQTWSYCPFNSTSFNSSGCWQEGTTYIGALTVNGISNVTKIQNSRFSQLGYTGLSKHTEFYKYAGYDSSCSTGSQVRFYVEVVMADVEGVFTNSALDPNAWPTTPTIRSVNVKSGNYTFNQFYNWLGNDSNNLTNKVGVSAGKSDGTGFSNCSFVSYGSNKSVKYLCSTDTGSGGRQIKLNFYNYNNQYESILSSHSAMIVSGIKVSLLSDPCSQESSNNQGVINSINGQTGTIANGVAGIIENNNSNTETIHNDLEDIKDNQETTIDKLNTINSTLQNNHNDLIDSNLNPNLGGGSGAGHYFGQFGSRVEDTPISSLVLLPVNLLQHLVDTLDDSSCSSYYLPFDIIPQNNRSGAGHTLEFTCPNLEQKLGTDLYNTIDICICIFMFYKIAMMIIKWFEKTTDLKDQFYDLYNEH